LIQYQFREQTSLYKSPIGNSVGDLSHLIYQNLLGKPGTELTRQVFHLWKAENWYEEGKGMRIFRSEISFGNFGVPSKKFRVS